MRKLHDRIKLAEHVIDASVVTLLGAGLFRRTARGSLSQALDQLNEGASMRRKKPSKTHSNDGFAGGF